jgi:hypothetical protein
MISSAVVWRPCFGNYTLKNGWNERLETAKVTSSSQIISADGLVDLLTSTFGKTSIMEFRKFLAKHPRVTKWMIASDFVLNDPKAVSDAYAYTFFPYNAEIQQIRARLKNLLPEDFKKTKTIKPALNEFFQSGETFTICLLTPKKFSVAGDIHAVRLSLEETLKNMRNWQDAGNQKPLIKQFERLKERAKANNFNAQLVSTMIIATVLAAFCAIILAQERKIEIVGWFPDRDDITTSYGRIAHHMFSVDFSAFCQRHNIDERQIKTGIGLPEPDPVNPKQSWYDELVRIPDFFAGPLAVWDYHKNLVPDRQKYMELVQGAVADNPYLVVLLLSQRNEGIGVGRLLTSKTPFSDSPQTG